MPRQFRKDRGGVVECHVTRYDRDHYTYRDIELRRTDGTWRISFDNAHESFPGKRLVEVIREIKRSGFKIKEGRKVWVEFGGRNVIHSTRSNKIAARRNERGPHKKHGAMREERLEAQVS